MCGISGVVPLKEIEPQRLFDMVKALLLKNKSRGTDATGIANWETGLPDKIDIWKSNCGADDFLNKINPEMTTGNIICHNRAQTKGCATQKDNNHPMFGERFCIVHNGMISMKNRDDYTYKGQCDTEILLSYIEREGVEEAIPMIDGSACVALFDKEEKSLHLFKHNNPLYIGYIVGTLFAFSSTKDCLEELPKILGLEKSLGLFSQINIKELSEGDYIKMNLQNGTVINKNIPVPYKYARWTK